MEELLIKYGNVLSMREQMSTVNLALTQLLLILNIKQG